MSATGGGKSYPRKAIFDLIAAYGAGIENATILDPAGDIIVGANQKILPGTVEVS